MAWTIYRSTDASAPVLTGEVGKLVDLLDAVLVNGYGAQSAAGWSKPYSGTNKAAFRPGASATARQYFRFDDSAADGTAGYCRISGYESMSDVDTGSGLIEMSVAYPYWPLRKSVTASATARAWIIAADHETCILFIQDGFTPTGWGTTYFGNIYSYVSGDAYKGVIFCRAPFSGPPLDGSISLYPIGFTAQHTGGIDNTDYLDNYPHGKICRDYDGSPDSMPCALAAHTFLSTGTNNPIQGGFTGTNPASGDVLLTKVPVVHNRSAACIRGHLKGIWYPHWTVNFFLEGDTFAGSGGLSGKDFEILQIMAWVNPSGANVCFETSNTVTAST